MSVVSASGENKISVFVAVLTFIGTIIGGGVVGIPTVFKFTGIIFGIVMNLACALGSIYAVWLLIQVKNMTGLSSYSELGYLCYGRASIFVINVLIATATAGMPIAYFMIFGHICP
jgi:amino acid permease